MLTLRRDGAEDIEPVISTWSIQPEGVAGTYALLLCRDPDAASPRWLVIRAGVVAPLSFWASEVGRGCRRFGVEAGTPVLTVPLLTEPALDGPLWAVTVQSGGWPGTTGGRQYERLGTFHRWVGADAVALAARAIGDLLALFPPERSERR